jgi:hypothetical protein
MSRAMPHAHRIAARTILAAVTCAMLSIGPAAAGQRPPTLAEKLKAAEAARDLAEVKLASEIERSDGQAYLLRLELAVTKRQLAAALAKCGAACAPEKK